MAQRELKFRAFTKDGVMQYDVTPWQWDFVIDTMAHICIESNGSGPLGSGGARGRFEVFGVAHEAIMQFTGLLDKNGKEIYEGDVIVADSYPFFNDGVPGYVGVVEWAYGAWYYGLHCVNENLVGSAVGDQLGADGNEVTRFRIIGNIHENPELLEG